MVFYRVLMPLLLLCMSASTWASFDSYEFETALERERFAVLTEELRCPKCQNQNIADSDAPIAQDLRREIHEQIQSGADDEAIVAFMVARYGDFVRYKPVLSTKTGLLWGAPLLFLLIGVGLLLNLRQRKKQTQSLPPLSPEEQQRLQTLLKREPKK